MPSNHLILCRPLLLLPSIFPSIRVFSNESALRIRWPKYWKFQLQHQSFQWTLRKQYIPMYIYYFSHKWPKYWSTMEGQKVSGLALLTRLELESWGLCSKLWNFSNFPDVSWIQIYRSGACNLLNSGQRWALTKNWPAFFVAMRLSPHWVSLHLPGNHILNTHVTVWLAQKEHWLLYAVESSSSLHPQWVSFWASPHGTWYPVMPFSPPKSPPSLLTYPPFPFVSTPQGRYHRCPHRVEFITLFPLRLTSVTVCAKAFFILWLFLFIPQPHPFPNS